MDKDEAETIRLEDATTSLGITFGLRELHPETIVSAQHRLQTYAERLAGTHLDLLFREAEKSTEHSATGKTALSHALCHEAPC